MTIRIETNQGCHFRFLLHNLMSLFRWPNYYNVEWDEILLDLHQEDHRGIGYWIAQRDRDRINFSIVLDKKIVLEEGSQIITMWMDEKMHYHAEAH